MAGSYNHVIGDDGKFRGMELIENLGDAHECIEELLLMIYYLSKDNKTLMRQAMESASYKSETGAIDKLVFYKER